MTFKAKKLRMILICITISLKLVGCKESATPIVTNDDFFIELIKWTAKDDLISKKNLEIAEQYLTKILEIKSEIPNFSGTPVNVTCELLEISNFLAHKFNNNKLRNKTELVKLALSTKVFSDDTPAITYQKCRVIYGLKFPERKFRALNSK